MQRLLLRGLWLPQGRVHVQRPRRPPRQDLHLPRQNDVIQQTGPTKVVHTCRYSSWNYLISSNRSRLRLEVALSFENFILKAIAYRIYSNIDRKITTGKKLTSRSLYLKEYGMTSFFTIETHFFEQSLGLVVRMRASLVFFIFANLDRRVFGTVLFFKKFHQMSPFCVSTCFNIEGMTFLKPKGMPIFGFFFTVPHLKKISPICFSDDFSQRKAFFETTGRAPFDFLAF